MLIGQIIVFNKRLFVKQIERPEFLVPSLPNINLIIAV